MVLVKCTKQRRLHLNATAGRCDGTRQPSQTITAPYVLALGRKWTHTNYKSEVYGATIRGRAEIGTIEHEGFDIDKARNALGEDRFAGLEKFLADKSVFVCGHRTAENGYESTASTRMTSKHFYRALVMSVFDLQTHMHASLRLLAIKCGEVLGALRVLHHGQADGRIFFVAAEHGLDVGQPVNFCAPSNRVPRFPVPPSAPKLRGQTSPLLP